MVVGLEDLKLVGAVQNPHRPYLLSGSLKVKTMKLGRNTMPNAFF